MYMHVLCACVHVECTKCHIDVYVNSCHVYFIIHVCVYHLSCVVLTYTSAVSLGFKQPSYTTTEGTPQILCVEVPPGSVQRNVKFTASSQDDTAIIAAGKREYKYKCNVISCLV